MEDAINNVFSYIGDVDDWLVIKKELLKTLSAADRMYFSTRDPITKKQRTNTFEKIVMEKWFVMTGVRPIFIEHDEKQ